jgi:hypothetical protein
MSAQLIARFTALALAVVGAAGCNQTTSVSGSVTYNGEIVEKGAISFAPADGQSASAGAMITDGKYKVNEIAPGSKIVTIRGAKKVNFAGSSEEAIQMSQEAIASGKEWAGHLSDPADYIPADAEGNKQTIEINPGASTIDFELQGPPRP